ncbi:unnamed protein product [Heterobilharzia americana]|nr:unnamed protein product [Heterobilharzia americana]
MLDSKVKNINAIGFPYPIYVVDVLDRNSLVVAGGGGAVKTGVPNRIDIINLYRNDKSDPIPIDCQRSGGLDTGTKAVMSLNVITPGDGGCIASLEGQKCVEYIAHSKVNLVTSPLKSSSVENHSSVTENPGEINLRQRTGKCEKTSAHSEPNKPQISLEQDSIKKDEISLNDPVPLEWELTKVREYTLIQQAACSADDSGSESPSGSVPTSLLGTPTCVTHGGPAGTWLAVGSDSEFPPSEHQLDDISSQPLILYPDVSGGLSTGVCSMAFSHPCVCNPSDSVSYPLLATICDRPDWSTLRVWRTDSRIPKSFLPLSDVNQHAYTDAYENTFKLQDQILFSHSVEKHPYAIASCSAVSCSATPPPSPTLTSSASTSGKVVDRSHDRSTYRFRHCQFMKYSIAPQVSANQTLSTDSKVDKSDGVESMLVTTLQPLCANRKSFSHLVVWSVPHPSMEICESSNSGRMHQPVQLTTFAEITLPQGHLPACLAVHPSRSRGLIAVGTMEGRVDVYFLSPSNHRLVNVYSLNNAHPIFVTALTFLQQDSSVLTRTSHKVVSRTALKSDSFDLVSVSVDRLVKWHRGPAYSTVGQLSRGIINTDNTSWLRTTLKPRICISVLNILSVLLLPVLIMFFEAFLSQF